MIREAYGNGYLSVGIKNIAVGTGHKFMQFRHAEGVSSLFLTRAKGLVVPTWVRGLH